MAKMAGSKIELLIYPPGPNNPVQAYPLPMDKDKKELIIGLGENADLKLMDDPTISWNQIQLTRRGIYFFVSNLSMDVPTHLNEKSLPFGEEPGTRLRHEDQIKFGNYRMVFLDARDTRLRRPKPPLPPPDHPGNLPRPENTTKVESAAPNLPGLAAREKGFELKVGEAHFRNRKARLTPLPYKLVKCLYESYPEVCNMQVIGQALEDSTSGEFFKLVNTARSQLAKGFGKNGRNLIETQRGYGYKLNLDLTFGDE